jgi:hypothetical protein
MSTVTEQTTGHVTIPTSSEMNAIDSRNEQHVKRGRPWARFITHYTVALVSILELATLMMIIAFRRTDVAIGGAIFGLLAIIVLMGLKVRLDSSEVARLLHFKGSRDSSPPRS